MLKLYNRNIYDMLAFFGLLGLILCYFFYLHHIPKLAFKSMHAFTCTYLMYNKEMLYYITI